MNTGMVERGVHFVEKGGWKADVWVKGRKGQRRVGVWVMAGRGVTEEGPEKAGVLEKRARVQKLWMAPSQHPALHKN